PAHSDQHPAGALEHRTTPPAAVPASRAPCLLVRQGDARMPNETSRRNPLLGAAGSVGAAAPSGGEGGLAWASGTPAPVPTPARISACSEAVQRREQARRAAGSGRTVRASLTAEPTEVDLGGRIVRTWAYNGQIPGPVIRCTAGEQLAVEVSN